MDCMLISDVMDSHATFFCGHWNETKFSGKRKHWMPDDSPPAIKIKKQIGDAMSSWEQVEELAADLDGTCSLSNLSVDLNSAAAFANSEGLLSLPSLSSFKQELLSPFNTNELCDKNPQLSPSNEKPVYNAVIDYVGVGSGSAQEAEEEAPPSVGRLSQPATPTAPQSTTILEDCRFQYVLAAATSIATKVNEETLTYLNQGQSYEIKVKKLGDLSECRGKILKSVVRLCFHERRLQYMEREQLLAWEAMHPGHSILEVDLPLSYGIVDISYEHKFRNAVEFLWDPTKEVGVYIKVNCISTEFTPNKHGGEKGVPFRIQVDTYLHGEQPKKLHSASCQVKVFKLKGADRKHKQDREKVLKRPLIEQEKYQCSCDCTILTDVPINGDVDYSPPNLPSLPVPVPLNNDLSKVRLVPPVLDKDQSSPACQVSSPLHQGGSGTGVMVGWSAEETRGWLSAQRFQCHLGTLSSFDGADLLCLTREQTVQLCGLGDGVRLYNAVRAHLQPPLRTLYVTADSRLHRALFLSTLTAAHLADRLASALCLSEPPRLLVAGPGGIRVIVTDELVAHLPDQSVFTLHVSREDNHERRLQVLMVPSADQPVG